MVIFIVLFLEFLPIKIGEFNVEALDGLKFKVIIDEEQSRIFGAANEDEKGKCIRILGKLSGQQLEGEKELIHDLRLKTESIDSPQSYYLKNMSQLTTYKELPNTREFLEISDDSTEVKCATFDKLIEILISPYQFDNLFVYTFLLTLRNFTTPIELLEKLISRYNVAPNQPVTDKDFQKFKIDVLLPIRLRICQVLRLWLARHGRDFRQSPEALERLNSFIDEMNKTKIGMGGDQLTQSIKKYVNKRDTFELQQLEMGKTTNNSKPLPKSLLPKSIEKLTPKDKDYATKVAALELSDWPAVEVARQMSLLEFSVFERIQPKEALNQSWNKENRETKAPNIHKMIQQTNTLVNWIANEVLKHDKVANRTKAITYLIDLANECKTLNNFNSMMGVLGGLNSIGVKRLEKSWAGLKEDVKKVKAELDEFVSRKKSYGELRRGVKVAQPPILPYMGLYLTDLTFIEDSNKNELNDKINFSKCRRLAKVIREIQTCQQQAYEFALVPELESKLKMN
jgi:son of sevenless-like protein